MAAVLTAPCFGQELRGRIVDSGGAAIAGARVTASAQGRAQVSITSPHGEFALSNVPKPATLRVSSPGFADVEITWNGDQEITITLRPASARSEVVVSATRSRSELADVPSAVSVLNSMQLESAPELMLDGVLRQVPGFSLFRRSDSRTANPTSQGVSLRGSGASGASRALVLYDGVPLNDAFGGWVYWDRIPRTEIGSVEMLRGAGTGLYGSGALSGVVALNPALHPGPNVSLETTAGTDNTDAATASLDADFGRWRLGTAVEAFQTDGYVPIPAESRGAVDRPTNLRYGTGRFTLGRTWSHVTMLVSANLFDEGRQNGTLLQVNSTRLAEGTAALIADLAGGTLEFRTYGSGQHFNQTFSSVSADRNRETLVRVQAVPAQQNGLAMQWSRREWKGHAVVIGMDVRRVAGRSDELLPSATGPTSRTIAGGQQLLSGFFAGDTFAVGPRLHVNASLRFDHWSNHDADTLSFASLSVVIPIQQRLSSRSAGSVSPSLGAAVRLGRGISLKGSGYGSFRAPTLNELYRTFRLGDVLTQANDALNAERLWGGEGGLLIGRDSLFVSASVFYDQIHDSIGNRTLSTTPSLITRQRQNIGTIRTSGVEIEGHAALAPFLRLNGSYELADSVVLTSHDAALLGLAVPQVPRHSGSLFLSSAVRRWSGMVGGRYAGRQFDDDLNQFPLSGYFLAEGRIEFRAATQASFFLSMENALERTYPIARTPSVTVGAPRLVRAGVRLHLARSKGK
jgi:outer membrane receptor protein involved in Fe transport